MRTSNEHWGEDVRCLVHEATLSGDADSSQRVVSSNHATGEVSVPQRLNGRSRPGLQFVLEDDQSQELQTRLGLLPSTLSQTAVALEWEAHSPLHLLCPEPR